MNTSPAEHVEQAAVFAWANRHELDYPDLRNLFSIPYGMPTSKAGINRLCNTGMRAGVPDILLLAARGRYHGLAIEMKRIDGGKTTDAQKDWMQRLNGAGYFARVCRGAAAAIEVIECYLTEGKNKFVQ